MSGPIVAWALFAQLACLWFFVGTLLWSSSQRSKAMAAFGSVLIDVLIALLMWRAE